MVDAGKMTDCPRLKWVLGRRELGQRVRAKVRLSDEEVNSAIQASAPLVPSKNFLPHEPSGEPAADCKVFHFTLQLLVRRINERITFAWNLKDDLVQNGLPSKRMHEASVLYSYISQIEIEIESIRKGIDRNDRLYGVFLNDHAVQKTMTSLKGRFDRLVRWHAQQAVIEQTKQIISKSPSMFLSSSATGSVLPLKAVKWFFGQCIRCGSSEGDAQSNCSTSQRAESAFITVLRSQAIDCVFQSFRAVHPHDAVLVAQATELAVNSAVHGMLHAIVVSGEQFDEMGVYKLYRILLQLHEVVAEIKTELGIPAGQRLIQDVTEWRRAEAVVQALNLAVFATSPSKDGESSPRTSADRLTPSPAVEAESVERATVLPVVLTPSELRRWRTLVHPPKHAFLPRRSRRHRGTVFATLTFDFDAL